MEALAHVVAYQIDEFGCCLWKLELPGVVQPVTCMDHVHTPDGPRLVNGDVSGVLVLEYSRIAAADAGPATVQRAPDPTELEPDTLVIVGRYEGRVVFCDGFYHLVSGIVPVLVTAELNDFRVDTEVGQWVSASGLAAFYPNSRLDKEHPDSEQRDMPSELRSVTP